MMWFALVASALLLAAFLSAKPGGKIRPLVPAVALFMSCVVMVPVVILQGIMLLIARVVCVGEYRRHFPAASVGVTLAAWAFVVGVLVLPTYSGYEALRKKFDWESLADRLPTRATAAAPVFAEALLAENERDIDAQISKNLNWGRLWAIRRLHEERVKLFANTPGFGVVRIAFHPTEGMIDDNYATGRNSPPIPQAAPESNWHDSYPMDNVGKGTPSAAKLHDAVAADFLNPIRWGLVRGRDRVAGFLPHAITQQPKAPDNFAVRRLDLVSLLIHFPPAVYVTDTMPRMGDLRGADVPIRPLDPFEGEALAKLQAGEDIVSAEGPRGVRVLGALRAAKQCVDCHAVQRGELLGAFSYRLAAR